MGYFVAQVLHSFFTSFLNILTLPLMDCTSNSIPFNCMSVLIHINLIRPFLNQRRLCFVCVNINILLTCIKRHTNKWNVYQIYSNTWTLFAPTLHLFFFQFFVFSPLSLNAYTFLLKKNKASKISKPSSLSRWHFIFMFTVEKAVTKAVKNCNSFLSIAWGAYPALPCHQYCSILSIAL